MRRYVRLIMILEEQQQKNMVFGINQRDYSLFLFVTTYALCDNRYIKQNNVVFEIKQRDIVTVADCALIVILFYRRAS